VNDEAIRQAMVVKARHEASLMQKANVIGVGVGFRQQQGKLTDALIPLIRLT